MAPRITFFFLYLLMFQDLMLPRRVMLGWVCGFFRLWGSQRCSVTSWGYIPRWQPTGFATLTTVPGVIRYKGAKIQVSQAYRPRTGRSQFFHSQRRTYLELSVCQETFCMLIFDLQNLFGQQGDRRPVHRNKIVCKTQRKEGLLFPPEDGVGKVW